MMLSIKGKKLSKTTWPNEEIQLPTLLNHKFIVTKCLVSLDIQA